MLFTSLLKVPVLAGLCSLAIAVPAPSSFTFYDMPTPLSGPCDSCTGPDGALWVQNFLVDTIARIDPKTGVVEGMSTVSQPVPPLTEHLEFPIPYTLPVLDTSVLPGIGLKQLGGRTAFACAIRPGNDGNLYAASGIRNQFLRINPTTRKIDVFSMWSLLSQRIQLTFQSTETIQSCRRPFSIQRLDCWTGRNVLQSNDWRLNYTSQL